MNRKFALFTAFAFCTISSSFAFGQAPENNAKTSIAFKKASLMGRFRFTQEPTSKLWTAQSAGTHAMFEIMAGVKSNPKSRNEYILVLQCNKHPYGPKMDEIYYAVATEEIDIHNIYDPSAVEYHKIGLPLYLEVKFNRVVYLKKNSDENLYIALKIGKFQKGKPAEIDCYNFWPDSAEMEKKFKVEYEAVMQSWIDLHKKMRR